VYDALFRSADAPLRGLALGIAGDRCTQLLYRLDHGEIPSGLHAKAFWVLIGTNDFLWGSCHADEIVAGNVRVVQALLQQYPGTTVFVQSVLPVSVTRRINNDAFPAAQSWDVYPDINRRLECYALSTPNVEFVNVTQLFLSSQGEKKVNETMLPDGLHPGGIAAGIWGNVIVENVQRVLRSNKPGQRQQG
jgi:lysophospholipase L1-like esterase